MLDWLYPTFIHNPAQILYGLIDVELIPHTNVSKIQFGEENTGLITAQYQKIGSVRTKRKGCPTYAPVTGLGRKERGCYFPSNPPEDSMLLWSVL